MFWHASYLFFFNETVMLELLFSHTEVIRSAESISCQLPAVLQLQCIFIAEYFPLTAQCFDSRTLSLHNVT